MLVGNIQFNSEKLRQGYKPIFAIKFDNYAGTAHKYYASKTVTLDGNSYLMMCESLPKITRSIEYLGGLSTIGSVNLTIINQEKESDFLQTVGLGYIMGSALIAIVFNDGTTPLWTERLEIFTGKIDDLNEISEDSLGFSLIDSSKLTGKTIGTLVTAEDYPKLRSEDIGKIIPIIYGDHSFKYGMDGTTDFANFVRAQTNNLIPCIFIGVDTNGDANFLAASHGLHTVYDTYYRPWIFDSAIGRSMMPDDVPTVTYSGGVTTYKIGADCHLFDFCFPDGTVSNEINIGDPDWVNAANMCDGDYDTYSQSVILTDASVNDKSRIDVDFPTYDGNQAEENLIELVIYSRSDFDSASPANFEFSLDDNDSVEGFSEAALQQAKVYGIGAFTSRFKEITPVLEAVDWTCTDGWSAGSAQLIKIAGVGIGTATPSGGFSIEIGMVYKIIIICSAVSGTISYTMGGVSGTNITATTIIDYITAINTNSIVFSGGAATTCTITSISVVAINPSSSVTVLHKKTGATADTSTAKIYELFKRIEYLPSESPELYIACKGYVYDTWIHNRTAVTDSDPNTGLPYTTTHPDDDGHGNLIENPVGVIESVLRDLLGFGNSDIEMNSFNVAAAARDGWKYSFAILEQLKGDAVLEFLSKLAFECQCWLFWNYANRLEIIAYSASANFSASGGATPISDDIFIHQPENIALEFDGTANAKITHSSSASHQITGSMTFECYCYFEDFTNRVIIDCGASGETEAANVLYRLKMIDERTIEYRHEYGSGSDEILTINLSDELQTGVWYYLSFTRDVVWHKKLINITFRYIRGYDIISSGTDAYVNAPTGGGNSILIFGNDFTFTLPFYGKLKECRLWADVRSGSELLNNQNKILIGNEASLVGYWRLDEGAGTATDDITSNSKNGTVGAGCSWSTNKTYPTMSYYAQHPIVKDSFKITLMSTADLVNDLTINYFKNYQSGQTQKTSNTTDAGSIAKYGTLTETVESEFIADTTTAESFRDLLLTKKKEKYYVATFKSWLNAATKTEGDIINIRHPILDNGIMSNANMIAAKWQIIKIGHDLNNGEIEITAVILSIP